MKIGVIAKKWLKATWWIMVILLSVALVFSGYGGVINPDESTFGAFAVMAFPAVFIISLLALILSIWVSKWSVVPLVISMIACYNPIKEFSPLNFGSQELTYKERERAFSLMSYNVYAFKNSDGDYSSDPVNKTLSYIIEKEADIACLQECEFMCELPSFHVFQPQVDSINAIYPYVYVDEGGNSILSKYKFEKLNIKAPKVFRGRIAAYRVDMRGEKLTIFNVHMTSIGLSDDDKELYQSMAHLDIEGDFEKVRHQLLGKLSIAFRERAEQARALRRLIDEVGGENVIVCGDFNDVPGSYALRTVMGDDMRSVYTEVGCGPMITYYANMFYFRIDHILYKGNFKPKWIERGNLQTSDHYPLLTEFVWNS